MEQHRSTASLLSAAELNTHTSFINRDITRSASKGKDYFIMGINILVNLGELVL